MIMESTNSLDKYLNDLDADQGKKDFIKRRILAFQEIEKQISELKPLLRNEQKKTLAYYKKSPNYAIITPTDLVLDYLKDIKDILKPEE
jgi:hypothetical protein